MFPYIRVSAAMVLVAALPPAAGAQQPAPQPLDTVRVAVTSRLAPSIVSAQRSVEVIGRDAIERRPSRSIGDLLASALGADLQSRSPAQADLAIRGSSLGQVLVLVDGVRVSDLQTAHFDLDLAVPLDAVDRIEILRGPGATLYGPDAVGGVVNIVTRRGEAWARGRAFGGSFGTAGLALGGARPVGSTSLRAAAEGERSSGHRDGTDYQIVQATLGAERLLPGGRLTADVGLAGRNFGAADFYAPAPSFERTRSQTAALRYTGDAGDGWALSSAVSVRRHTDDFILRRADPGFYRNAHITLQSAVEVGVRRSLTDAAGVALGLEAFDAQLESARLGNRREQRASAFAEATLGRAEGANTSAGARLDRSTALGTFVSPSLAVSLPVHRTVRLRGSAGRGLRAPSWTERHYRDPANVADPSIGPERFWAAEAGVRFVPQWGSIDFAAHYRRADDLIDWVRAADAEAGTPWTTANLEAATYRGLEVVAGTPDVGGVDLTVRASVLDFDAIVSPEVVGKYALRPLTRVVGLTATRELARGLRATVDLRNARRVNEEAYVHANVRTTMRLGGVMLHVDVTNIAGADYLDASAKPVAGRAVVVGVQF